MVYLFVRKVLTHDFIFATGHWQVLHYDEFKPSKNLLGMRADHDSHAITDFQLKRLLMIMVHRHEHSFFPILSMDFLNMIE